MKVFKPLQVSLLHKSFELKGRHRLSVALLFGFPFDGSEPLLEPDLWNFIAGEMGKSGVLDIGMPKPNGEVVVYGKYFSPNGTPVKADAVRLKMGTIDKTLLVFGNRYWRTLLGPTEPEPFTSLPLDYAHAFGGEGFARNPIGKGMVDVDLFGEKRRPVPNIEHPDHVMTFPGQRPDPAGFGPLDMTWEFRASKLGTYDEKWIKERWPAYPDDLDWNHFNTAPRDQWLETFFNGDEAFELFNMHPEKPLVTGRLPALRARCFVKRASSMEGSLDELLLRAETVCLFPHAETAVVLYRGVVDIDTDDASDIQSLIIGYENLTEAPRELSHYATALARRQAGKHAMNTTDLIPPGAQCGFGAVPDLEPEPGADADKPEEPTRREELTALAEKLALIPGAQAARVKVEEAIAALDLPPLFPRPPGHEHINELIAEKRRAEARREAIRQRGGNPNAVPMPTVDIEATRAKLEEAGREMKEGYRAQAHLMDEGRPAHEKQLKNIRQELFARLEKKESVAGWDLAGLDLSNQDLTGIDLSGCYLEGVDFTNAKLKGARLEGAILAFANLSRCDLSAAHLKRANLGASNLADAVLDGADMTEATLARSNLSSAKLTRCNLTGADLSEAQLGGADLSGSTLPQAQLFDLYMAKAKFQEAMLAGSTFTHCNLEESDFSEAVLDETAWIGSWLDGANFIGARMGNSRFPGGCSLRGAQFVRAVLDASNFRDSDISHADFTEASINQCDFGGANAQQARFTRATARMAQFIGADLGDADLVSMDLREGTLMKARLTGATLRDANCYGVEFMNATVGGTDFSGAILYRTKLEHWRPS